MQRLDIGRAFVYAFEDPEWVAKLLIGTLIFLVSLVFSVVLIGIIPGLMLSGYVVAIARHVASGPDVPLPRWDDFGTLLADGFRVFLAQFVWSIPLMILALPLMVLFLAIGDSDSMSVVASLIALLCGSLTFIYSLFLLLITPLIYLMVATEEGLGAGLNIGRMWGFLRAYPGEVIIVAIMVVVAQFLAGIVGTILCLVGVLVTYIWYLWVTGHLVGQLARLEAAPAAESVETSI